MISASSAPIAQAQGEVASSHRVSGRNGELPARVNAARV